MRKQIPIPDLENDHEGDFLDQLTALTTMPELSMGQIPTRHPSANSTKFFGGISVKQRDATFDRCHGTYVFYSKSKRIATFTCESKKEAKRIKARLEKETKRKITFILQREQDSDVEI